MIRKLRHFVLKSIVITSLLLPVLPEHATHAQTCVVPSSGLVHWWPGDGNADDITGSNPGVLEGDTVFASGKVDQAFSFDGAGDRVTVADASSLNLGTHTISVWIHPEAQLYPNNGLVAKQTPSNTSRNYYLGLTNSNFIRYSLGNGSSGVLDLTSTPIVPDNAWTHIVATYDGATMKIFINGQHNTSRAGPASIPTTTEPLTIGDTNEVSNAYFSGEIDEVSLYNRALSDSEIQAIFAADSSGKCKDSTELQIVQTELEIYPGDNVELDLDVLDAQSLYGVQASCEVDPTILSVQGGSFGDLFPNPLAVVNDTDDIDGTWTGAATLKGQAQAVSGDGTYATLTYEALIPGAAMVSCTQLGADIDGFPLPIVSEDATLTVLDFSTISGTVQYQGRLDHTNISLTTSSSPTASTTLDGDFILDGIRNGTYDIQADASLYLPNCVSATVTNNSPVVLLPTRLVGGDTNDDNKIKIGDATLVATNFGMAVPPADPAADINNDGNVDIGDLALIGGNFDLKNCQPW
ncbi:MAG: LamG-like jellyroll fold domain-containing protein [Chloroflexota bacterium]